MTNEKKGVYTPDIKNDNKEVIIPTEPIREYTTFLRPTDNKEAVALGDKCVEEITKNIIADFERTESYCKKHGEENPDLMVHVSTFVIIDGIVYMTYYASTGHAEETPDNQSARLAYCPVDNVEDMTIIEIQKAGDTLDGVKITCVYDTILMHDGGDEIYILWTASPEDNYYRFYRTFNIKTKTLSDIKANRFKVGEITNDFSITGMKAALAYNNIPFKAMWTDIGIMQKLSSRIENGEKWYYTGAYSGNFNCIIKSRDFITWEYVSAPDFINLSVWENATYVWGDKVYYFVRQQESGQGFLTTYDLINKCWETPTLIADSSSRSDFVIYNNELYLIHSPKNREGFGIVKVDTNDIKNVKTVFVADMKSSCFYPFVRLYGDDAYISYTIDRKHIRLSKFNFKNYI